MKIVSIDGFYAIGQSRNIRRQINLYLLQHYPLALGDYVLVHVGYAIQKISEQDAQATWGLVEQMNKHKDQDNA